MTKTISTAIVCSLAYYFVEGPTLPHLGSCEVGWLKRLPMQTGGRSLINIKASLEMEKNIEP